MNYQSICLDAIETVLAWDLPDEAFADALNTREPLKSTGAVGLVPAYSLWDLAASFRIAKMLELRANLNNLMNKQYFTKRPAFYPGPGVWPSDGRNASLTVICRL